MKYFTAVCVLLSCLTLVLGAASCGTKDTTAPSIPTEIDTTIPANDATPTFTWSAATDDDSGVDHYLVAVASAAVPTGAVLWVNVGNVTTYTVATALSDGSHTFVVKAVDKAGNEGGPCSLSFILDATPPSISSVAASGTSSSTVRITWTTNEPAIAKIEYSTGTMTAVAQPMTVPLLESYVMNHSYELTGLTANTTYHYRVRSIDACGNEAVSGDYTFTTG